MQTILGANGTISKLLAKELPQYTNKIRLVSRNPKKINESDELFPADLTNSDQVDKAIAGSTHVYLLVGFEYNSKVWRKNWPELMKDCINSCIKHQAKLIFFDNMYMYDPVFLASLTEETPIKPVIEKGKVRAEIANLLQTAYQSGKLEGMIVRAADFYGPNAERSVFIETVIKNLQKGKKAQWLGNPNKIHSLTFTPDAAKATAILANTDSAYNQVWHLPTLDELLTIQDMVNLIAKELNCKTSIQTLPNFMVKLIGLFVPILSELPEMRYQTDQDYFFDSSKFTKQFNWKATSYSDGIKQIINS